MDYNMATIWGPNIVTDGLVLSLDAANVESYAPAGKIPPKSESIADAWSEYGSGSSHYTVVGDDGVIIKNTSTGWVGRFVSPDNVLETGYYTVAFEYQSDGASQQIHVNDDGASGDQYNGYATATTTKQVYTDTNNVTGTGDSSRMYIRLTSSHANVTISNFRFYPSDSAGNSLKWHDLSGNGYVATLVNGPSHSSSGIIFHYLMVGILNLVQGILRLQFGIIIMVEQVMAVS